MPGTLWTDDSDNVRSSQEERGIGSLIISRVHLLSNQTQV